VAIHSPVGQSNHCKINLMKTTKHFSLFVCVLALTVIAATGCKKKPAKVTLLPNSKISTVGDLPPGGILPGGDNTGGITGGSSATGFPAGPGHIGWKEDHETLKTETVYFDYDSSTIKSSEKSKIENVAAYLKAHLSAAVKVEGNCDERGTEEYNRASANAARWPSANISSTPASPPTPWTP